MSSAALVLFAVAVLLGLGAALELLVAGRGGSPAAEGESPSPPHASGATPGPLPGLLASPALGPVLQRLSFGLEGRLVRAGLGERLGLGNLLPIKAAGAVAGALAGLLAAPAAPGNLGLLTVAAMPAAGWMAPDAWLERRARARLRALRSTLPDALDLLAVGASAGRSPLAGLAELGSGEGPLAEELAVLAAEASCGAPQREALAGLQRRVPAGEVAALCGLIERSRRFGSPLAEQLSDQATSLRAAQRRRTEEHAARAAPKIQLAVALLLVPSVLLMIAAGLLANMDRFLAGL